MVTAHELGGELAPLEYPFAGPLTERWRRYVARKLYGAWVEVVYVRPRSKNEVAVRLTFLGFADHGTALVSQHITGAVEHLAAAQIVRFRVVELGRIVCGYCGVWSSPAHLTEVPSGRFLHARCLSAIAERS